jgi:hypothetical protein
LGPNKLQKKGLLYNPLQCVRERVEKEQEKEGEAALGYINSTKIAYENRGD